MYVELKNINKSFGSFKASDDVSFGGEKGKLVKDMNASLYEVFMIVMRGIINLTPISVFCLIAFTMEVRSVFISLRIPVTPRLETT